MKLHANARTCPNSRQEIVRHVLAGRSRECVAAEFGISERTVAKWLARFRCEGELGLLDRSSAPRRVPSRTDPRRVQAIAALRRLRFSGPEIAELLDMPLSTTSAVLRRNGLGKLGRIGLEPAQRYERARSGELIHIDVKKLGRIQGGAGKRITGGNGNNGSLRRRDAAGVPRQLKGWDAVHIAIDDATRLAYARSCLTRKPRPRPRSCVARSTSTAGTGSPSNG
jgi:hypothetical protein